MADADPVPVVRPGGPDDDAAIAELLGVAAPQNPKADLDVLRWQYRREAFGPTVTALAEVDGQVIAHYSAVGIPVSVAGRPVRAAHGVDIATHPDHRGQGRFRAVAERLQHLAAAAGYELIVSNPNDDSAPTLGRLGWSTGPDPELLVVPVDGAALARRVGVPGPLGAAARRVVPGSGRRPPVGTLEVAAPPADLDELWVRVGPTAAPGTVRDRAWWCWRYADHPRAPYRIVEARRRGRLVGTMAVTVRDDEPRALLVLDLLAVDDAAVRELTRAACALARQHDAALLVAAASAGTSSRARLRSAGFLPVPRRLRPRPLHLAVLDLSGRALVPTPDRWEFALGDQDHL